MVAPASIQDQVVNCLGQFASFMDNPLQKYTDWTLIKDIKDELFKARNQEQFDNRVNDERTNQRGIATATAVATVALVAIWAMPMLASVAAFETLGIGAIIYSVAENQKEARESVTLCALGTMTFGAIRLMPNLAPVLAVICSIFGAIFYGSIEIGIHEAEEEFSDVLAARAVVED